MNKVRYHFLLCACALASTCALAVEQEKPHQCPPDLDEDGVAVLTQFAGIVGNFIGIVQAPHNPTNVGANLAGMIHGLANILTIATKSGKKLEDYVLTQEFQEEFTLLILSRAQQLDSDPDNL